LHSVVMSTPAVASSLLHGRRFGRSHAPVESADFDAACLQRVYREEDEASDDDTLDEAAPGMASQIFDVENELSDARFMTIDHHSSQRQTSSPLSTQSRQTSRLAASPQLLDSPRQNKKTLCVGANGMKRQQRFVAGLEHGILSESFSCRSSAVMLAAELAAVFVLDGSPALAAAAAPFFEPNESNFSNFSVSLVSQPSLIFSSSSRQALPTLLVAARHLMLYCFQNRRLTVRHSLCGCCCHSVKRAISLHALGQRSQVVDSARSFDN
jgi:hypothetical protein